MLCTKPFIIFQPFHLIAGVELCEVGDIPDEGEDDDGHHVDCAGQAGEPATKDLKDCPEMPRESCSSWDSQPLIYLETLDFSMILAILVCAWRGHISFSH